MTTTRHVKHDGIADAKQTTPNDLGGLADDARVLVSGTVEAVRERVGTGFEAAMDRGKQVYGQVRQQAIKSAKATDRLVLQYPYKAMGIALAVGAVTALFLARRK